MGFQFNAYRYEDRGNGRVGRNIWYQRDTFFVWFLAESRRNGVFWIPSLRGHGSAILNGALT